MSDIWALMRAIRRSALSAPEKHVLLTLTSLIDPGTGLIPERFQPSLTDLTRFTGLGRSTIARSLNSTEERGWVKRTVPTKYASQKNKEKTSYVLSVPADEAAEEPAEVSPTAGLVPERDQPESWSQSGTSPRVGLELVPQRDQVSPTVGLKELNLCTSMNQPPPPEGSTSAATGDPGALFSMPGQREPGTADEASESAPKEKAPAKRQRMSRAITKNPETLPADWVVSEQMAAWAKKTTPDVIQRLATEKFLVHFGDAGKRKKDWDATWRNWMLNDQIRFEARNTTARTPQGSAQNDYQGRRGSTYIRMTDSHHPSRDYSEPY